MVLPEKQQNARHTPMNPNENTLLHYIVAAVEYHLRCRQVLKRDVGLLLSQPNASEQRGNFSTKNRYCYDLIAQLPNSRLLMLEAKTSVAGKLRYYNKEQHTFLQVLWECHVPVYYIYNRATITELRHITIALEEAITSEPPVLLDHARRLWSSKHSCLRELIDRLVAPSSDGEQLEPGLCAYALFDELTQRGLEELNTEMLLLMYNSGRVTILKREDLLALIQTFREFARNNHINVKGRCAEDVARLVEQVQAGIAHCHAFLEARFPASISNTCRGNKPSDQGSSSTSTDLGSYPPLPGVGDDLWMHGRTRSEGEQEGKGISH